MSDLATILALLPRLDAAGLREVQSRAGALAQFGGGEPSHTLPASRGPASAGAPRDDLEDVLEQIGLYYREAGLEFVSPAALRRISGFGKFADKVEPVMTFLRKITTNRVRLRAVIALSLKLLDKDLRRQGLSTGPRLLMSQFHRIPGVIERSFPGYARSGMLPLILGNGIEYVQGDRSNTKGT